MLVFVIIPLYSILSLKASKVLGNGIWGIIEALCHYEVEMADLERLEFKRFLENQKCIRTHTLVPLIASYVQHVEPKNQAA